MLVWVNKECGNFHWTIAEAIAEAREMYGLGTESCTATLDELYEPTFIK